MKFTQRLILTLGLAFVFIAFGIDKFINPEAWQGYVPLWLAVPVIPFLYVIGAIEILLGILLFVQKTARIAAIGCAALLIGIILTLGWNEIMIRDVGLFAMAIVLILQPAQAYDARLLRFARRRR